MNTFLLDRVIRVPCDPDEMGFCKSVNADTTTGDLFFEGGRGRDKKSPVVGVVLGLEKKKG